MVLQEKLTPVEEGVLLTLLTFKQMGTQMDHSNRGSVSRKIISKEKTNIDQDKSEEVNVDPETSTTDFDDLASQLA